MGTTADSASTKYDIGTANAKATTTGATTIISTPNNVYITTSTNTLMTNTPTATRTSTLTTTTTTSIDVTITTRTMIDHAEQEETISTDWISQDSVLTGIILTCAVLFLLIVLIVMGYYFIHKHDTTVKKSCISSHGVSLCTVVDSS